MKKINIIYENEDLSVLNKPENLTVHKTNINDKQYTLVDFIIKKWPKIIKYHWPDKKRIGIVHRLDKDTSGIIIIAKNNQALEFLQNQFKKHSIKKIYTLLVLGKTPPTGEIKTYTSKDLKNYNQQKISLLNVSWQKGKKKTAITDYKAINYYKYKNNILSLVEAQIKTGRTHQIRNHFKYIGFPIIGDQIYNTKDSIQISKELKIKRQFLHATYLEFTNIDNRSKKIKIQLNKNLNNILSSLKKI